MRDNFGRALAKVTTPEFSRGGRVSDHHEISSFDFDQHISPAVPAATTPIDVSVIKTGVRFGNLVTEVIGDVVLRVLVL